MGTSAGPVTRGAADWCELIVRTDANVPKHKGLTALLVDMQSPGVEVRNLKQMTGESEFSEIFFSRCARARPQNVLGNVNDGWKVAIGTLMHERGTFGAALQVNYRRNFNRLVEIARQVHRNGKPATEDPVVRQKLGAVFRRNRSNALESNARLLANQ